MKATALELLREIRSRAGSVGGNAPVRPPELLGVSREDVEIIGRWQAAGGAAEIVLTATQGAALAAVKTLVPRRNTCPQIVNQCGRCLAWRPARLVPLDRARVHLCADCRGET